MRSFLVLAILAAYEAQTIAARQLRRSLRNWPHTTTLAPTVPIAPTELPEGVPQGMHPHAAPAGLAADSAGRSSDPEPEPAPAPAPAPAPPAPAPAATPGTWLECVLPKNKTASELHLNSTAVALAYANQSATPGDSAWFHCSGAVRLDDFVNGTGAANCTLPMVDVLDVGIQLMGSCWLSNGVGTPPLTQNAHFVVENRH